MDNNGQASAEFILLFGGIMVVVYMYKNYIKDLGGEIKSNEVNKLNNEIQNIENYFV